MNEYLIPSRPHPFPLDLSGAALLVIDVQNDFCHPEGFCQNDLQLDGSETRKIIEPIRQLAQWARKKKVPIIWTVEAHKTDLSDLAPSKKWRYEKAGYPVGSQGERGKFLVRGQWGTQVLAEISPQDHDLILPKPAQSVFVHTDLENTLRSRGVTHLLMCGVTTQCCVLASYRQANDLGVFFSLLLEDCCAAFDRAEHQAALTVITSEGGAVGWVTDSESLFAATL